MRTSRSCAAAAFLLSHCSLCEAVGAFAALPVADNTTVAFVAGSSSVTSVSYNLYWWHVSQHNEWSSLYNRIRSHASDLYGFQECNDVASVVGSALGSGYSHWQGPKKPDYNPAPLVWSNSVFSSVDGPGSVNIAYDRYKHRVFNWVRLHHRSSGQYVFFANTHGPLGSGCPSSLGGSWVDAIASHKRAGDHVILTGDFNCDRDTDAVSQVRSYLPVATDSGPDHIMSQSAMAWGGAHSGSPSDHFLLKAQHVLTAGPLPPSPPTPSPPSPSSGGWGLSVEGTGCASQAAMLGWFGGPAECADVARADGRCLSLHSSDGTQYGYFMYNVGGNGLGCRCCSDEYRGAEDREYNLYYWTSPASDVALV